MHCTKGSLSRHDFETRTASGRELFSLITRLHTITFTVLSTFSRLGMISIKIWETPLSWHTECSLPVAVRVSKTRVLKLPKKISEGMHSHISQCTNISFQCTGKFFLSAQTYFPVC